MKQSDLKPCAVCGRGMMHKGDVVFYQVAASYMAVNINAVRRQAGLEMQIGALASVMGPDEDLAQPISETGTVLLCLDCAIVTPVALLFQQNTTSETVE